jgi:hypothetical protein
MEIEPFVSNIFNLFDVNQRKTQRKFSNVAIFEFYEYQETINVYRKILFQVFPFDLLDD